MVSPRPRLIGPNRVGLPWGSLLAFVRISSNRRIFERPSPILSSWRQVEEWLALERVWIPEPTPGHREILGELLGHVGDDANLVPDAHLAALAIEHELTLFSADRGFALLRAALEESASAVGAGGRA